MTRALVRLVEDRVALVSAGEKILAAGRGRTVAGTESAARFPPTTIWAVSDDRLFVFDGGVKYRRGLDAPLHSYDIAAKVTAARIEPFDDRDRLLVVYVDGLAAIVVMDPKDAQAIVDLIVAVLEAPEPVPEVVLNLGAPAPAVPRGAPEHTGAVVNVEAVGEPRDPADGDRLVASMREAFARGDWKAGRDAISSCADARGREWCIRHLTGEHLADGLDGWVAAEPESPDAYLARGANAVWTAFAQRVDLGDETFFATLRDAELDLFWALELDFDDPVVFTPLVRSGRGLRIPLEELCMRFDESARRADDLLGVHLEILVALSPLGAGSVEDMLAFARSTAQRAADGSSLHMIVPMAHLIEFDTHQADIRRSGSFSSEAIRDVELSCAMSIDSGAWVESSAGVEAMNIAAAAMSRCGRLDRAAEYLGRAGGVRTFHPWSLLSAGDERFASVAEESDRMT